MDTEKRNGDIHRKWTAALLFVVCAVACCAIVTMRCLIVRSDNNMKDISSAVNSTRNDINDPVRQATERIARHYIATNLQWPETDYSIVITGKRRGELIEVIVDCHGNRSDDMLVVGGGKSMMLLIDNQEMIVVQALRFQ